MTMGTEMSIHQKASKFSGLQFSPLAFRTETLLAYLVVRSKLEAAYSANVEKPGTAKYRPLGVEYDKKH